MKFSYGFTILFLLLASVNSHEDRREKRQAAITLRKWAQNTVYYYLNGLSTHQNDVVNRVVSKFQLSTCINFVVNATARNRIKIYSDPAVNGCTSSNIGCKAGEQTIIMGTNCKYEGQLAKAFMHALGFYRMEVRSDRDTYVTFNSPSVHPDLVAGIGAINTTYSSNLLPYNYGSVLHSSYDAYVYEGSTNFPLIPKTSNYFWTIGSGIISSYDLNLVNTFYYCNNSCTGTKPTCVNGGNLNTRTCDKCNCPLGYAGTTCNTKPSDGGQQLTATTSWQNLSITISIVGTSPESPVPYLTRTYWIAKPAGSAYVQFKYVNFTNFAQPECDPGCRKRGIEIRYNANQEMTSPRMCCDSFNNVVVSSNLAITPVVAYSTVYAEFVVQYRAAGANDSQTPPPEVYTTTTSAPPTYTCPACPGPMPLIQPGETGDMCPDTNCNLLPSFAVNSTDGTGCRYAVSCTGSGWVSSYLSDYSYCAYTNPNDAPSMIVECKDGEWQVDVSPHGYSKISNVYCRENPEISCEPCASQPLPVKNPGATPACTNPFPPVTANTITNQTGQVDVFCQNEVRCTNPSDVLTVQYADTQGCVNTALTYGVLRCAGGAWSVNVGQGNFRPVSEMYCHAASAETTTTTTATTTTTDPCFANSAPLAQCAAQCPTGWTFVNGKCYQISEVDYDVDVNWNDAAAACRGLCSPPSSMCHLARLYSAQQGMDLANYVETNYWSNFYYIGIDVHKVIPGDPSNLEDGDGQVYACPLWDTANGEPAGSGDCSILRLNGLWGDFPCNRSLSHNACETDERLSAPCDPVDPPACRNCNMAGPTIGPEEGAPGTEGRDVPFPFQISDGGLDNDGCATLIYNCTVPNTAKIFINHPNYFLVHPPLNNTHTAIAELVCNANGTWEHRPRPDYTITADMIQCYNLVL